MLARSARKRNPRQTPAPLTSTQQAPPKVLHEHPKILLIDIRDDSEKVLAELGYNVVAGTFGTPYRVPKSDTLVPVIADPCLPNYEEQEVVVVDLTLREPAEGPQGEKHTSDGRTTGG